MLRHLTHSIGTIPSFKRLTEDWLYLCLLADKKIETKQRFYNKVWQTVERSLPIFIETTGSKLKLEEPEIWYIRILSNKVDGMHLDIRKFKKIENLTNVEYEPTDVGLTLTISNWFKLLDPVFKLLRKYGTNNKK